MPDKRPSAAEHHGGSSCRSQAGPPGRPGAALQGAPGPFIRVGISRAAPTRIGAGRRDRRRHPPASVRGAGTGGRWEPGAEAEGGSGDRAARADRSLPAGRPAHLWFASFSESKPPGAGWSGRQAGAHSGPGRHSPDGSRTGALSGDFSQNEILLSGCLAWVLLLFIPSLQRKCEAAKSIPVEMLSDQLGFPDTPGPGGRVCVRVHVRVRVCVSMHTPAGSLPSPSAARGCRAERNVSVWPCGVLWAGVPRA